MEIREINKSDTDWIKQVFIERWGGDFIVTRGKIYKIRELRGFIAELDNKNVGLITYKVKKGEIEIISLDSFLKNKGVGTNLVKAIMDLAKKEKIKRIWLITTNDNLSALKFWENRGFCVTRVYPNAIEKSRKIKLSIPAFGENNIAIKDEIELEIKL